MHTHIYIYNSSNGINCLFLLSDLRRLYVFYPLSENYFFFFFLLRGIFTSLVSFRISLFFLFCNFQSPLLLNILLHWVVPPCLLFLAHSILKKFCISFLFIVSPNISIFLLFQPPPTCFLVSLTVQSSFQWQLLLLSLLKIKVSWMARLALIGGNQFKDETWILFFKIQFSLSSLPALPNLHTSLLYFIYMISCQSRHFLENLRQIGWGILGFI